MSEKPSPDTRPTLSAQRPRRPVLETLAQVRLAVAAAYTDPRAAALGLRPTLDHVGRLLDGLGREVEEIDWRLARLESRLLAGAVDNPQEVER